MYFTHISGNVRLNYMRINNKVMQDDYEMHTK